MDDNILGEIDSLLDEKKVGNSASNGQTSQNELAQYFSNNDDDDFFANLSALKIAEDARSPPPPPPSSLPSLVRESPPPIVKVTPSTFSAEEDVFPKIEYGNANLLHPDDYDSLSGTSSTTQSQSSVQVQEHSERSQSQPRVRFVDDILSGYTTHKGDMNVASNEIHFTIQHSKSAWIPSDYTKSLFIAHQSRRNADYVIRPGVLPSPGFTEGVNSDPIKLLLIKHGGGESAPAALSRNSLTANDVTPDEKGLHFLIREGWYRAAIELTSKLLGNIGQGLGKLGQLSKHSPKSLWLWYTRFALMAQLKQWIPLESEMAAFLSLDTPDLYYEYYTDQYPMKEGSLVPFGMRLLHAELPAYASKFSESVDRLSYILFVVRSILQNLSNGLRENGKQSYSTEAIKVAQEVWLARQRAVTHSLINVLCLSRDYISAISLIQSTIQNTVTPIGYRSNLLSLLGRVYLQLGDVDSAKRVFQQSLQALCADNDEAASETYRFRDTIQNAFVCIGNNEFQDAKEYFKKCLEISPHNVMVCNNYAVCCLYLGLMRESIAVLESLLEREDVLHDITIFNLCTLYELESSKALHKKVKVLERVARIPGDCVHISSFKMSTTSA